MNKKINMKTLFVMLFSFVFVWLHLWPQLLDSLNISADLFLDRTNYQHNQKFTSSSAVCGLSSTAALSSPLMHPSGLFGKEHENKDRLKTLLKLRQR